MDADSVYAGEIYWATHLGITCKIELIYPSQTFPNAWLARRLADSATVIVDADQILRPSERRRRFEIGRRFEIDPVEALATAAVL